MDKDRAIWGPAMWASLHNLARGAPLRTGQDSPNYAGAFEAIFKTLPCTECSAHARAYLAGHPINDSSREALVKWVFDFHDAVNTRLGKPQFEVVPEGFIGVDESKLIYCRIVIAILIAIVVLDTLVIFMR